MHTDKITLLSILVAATALAGCSDAPPSGEFNKQSDDLAIDGGVDFTYTEAQDPYGEPTMGEVPTDQICAAVEDDVTEQLPRCIPASTEISVMLHSATDPGSGLTYDLVLVNESGDRNIGALDRSSDGMYTLEVTLEDENLQGDFSAAQIRYGDFVLATATTGAGGNSFEIHPDARSVAFSGSYSGKSFTVNVTGLQEGVSYAAWLVTIDDETGDKTHEEDFTVQAGENTFDASMAGDAYEQFHIHVAGTTINAGIAPIS